MAASPGGGARAAPMRQGRLSPPSVRCSALRHSRPLPPCLSAPPVSAPPGQRPARQRPARSAPRPVSAPPGQRPARSAPRPVQRPAPSAPRPVSAPPRQRPCPIRGTLPVSAPPRSARPVAPARHTPRPRQRTALCIHPGPGKGTSAYTPAAAKAPVHTPPAAAKAPVHTPLCLRCKGTCAYTPAAAKAPVHTPRPRQRHLCIHPGRGKGTCAYIWGRGPGDAGARGGPAAGKRAGLARGRERHILDWSAVIVGVHALAGWPPVTLQIAAVM